MFQKRESAHCRFTTYRHRFARVAPAPRAKLIDEDSKNRGRASPVKSAHCAHIFFFFFLVEGAHSTSPDYSREATSALWLTSHGAPLDCRRSTKSSAGWGFAEPGTSKGHNKVMARWIDDDPTVICRNDPSSRDSIEPVRSQVP